MAERSVCIYSRNVDRVYIYRVCIYNPLIEACGRCCCCGDGDGETARYRRLHRSRFIEKGAPGDMSDERRRRRC